MNKIENRRQIKLIVFLFAVTYMVSYITRINYGAVISEMVTSTGYSKSMLSMAVTGSFITYGIGQVISGIFGDKISPKKMITCGLCVASVMNILIPFCQNTYQMLAVWSVNGFAQSLMWPPMVKIMTAVLSDDDYKNGVTKVSWGSNIGTIVVYTVSPVLIALLSWRAVFCFAAILGIIMVFVWNRFACDVEIKPQKKIKKSDKKGKNVLFTPIMIGIMVAIILQGMLRDGVNTWMPSYISETYKLSNEISILTGVIMPIFSILCFQAVNKLYTAKIKNPLVCAMIFFSAGAVAAMGLYRFAGANPGLSVFMFAVLVGCMHAVNLMLICMIPMYFQNTGKVSTVSGVLNSCTYIGSAAATYGIAVFQGMFGWNSTILIWIAIAGGGAVICGICGKFWNK